ncbi:MAG: phosphopantothenoylcysteine decarboxylase [Sedimentisphaerales bacterium]|nr:phosphopantothenoylcysteine decarboxylase [Sedimentisphaerales bacterium]
MLAKKNILLGVTGGIAAYKAVDLASKITAAGANVKTVMTQNSCRFVGPLSFEGVSGSSVFTSMWTAPEEHKIGHIALADWADIVVVAPASANIIAKIANGICDDLLSTVLCACWNLAAQGKAMLAPAMNNKMWENPAVQRNVETVRKMGFQLVGPAEGRLACGTQGLGRMSEPQEILEAIERAAALPSASKSK